MGNFKMSICLKKVAEKSSTASMGFTREGSYKDDEVHSFLPLLPCQPSKLSQGKMKMNREEGGRKNLEAKAVLGGKKAGLQANDWAWGLGGSIASRQPLRGPPLSSLCCSLAVRDAASPWKAEVVLPLQTISLKQVSLSASAPWGWHLLEEWRQPENQTAKGHLALATGRRNPDLPLQSHWVLSPAPTIGPREVTTTPHQMYQESGRRLERLSMMWRQE